MKRRIEYPLAVAVFATLVPGCLLKLDGLDAGLDDESADSDSDGNCNGDNGDGDGDGGLDALECLIGTEVDALGVTQSSWAPPCEVTCAEGWGHDGDQLPIAWTTSVSAYPPGAHHNPRAIGLLDNGRVVVGIVGEQSVAFQFFQPDGVNFGGFEVAGFGRVQDVEIVSNRAYVTHDGGNGTVAVSAVGLSSSSEQELWRTTFGGASAPAVARGGGKVAFLLGLVDQDDFLQYDLVVLDLDGAPLWSAPVGGASNLAFSPSGERIAVVGNHDTRIYEAEDGDLIDEFVTDSWIYPWAVTFADEDRVIAVGGRLDLERWDAWLAGDSLAGGSVWEVSYNRATLWCPDPEDSPLSASTAEWLGDVIPLADGSLLAIGYESHEQDDVYGGQPWVVRFSAEGEYLASDRGLWNGYSVDTVAAPDGSVFVLIAGEGQPQDDPDLVIQDFWVRKYVP